VAIVLSLIAGIFAFINGLFRLLYAFFGLSMTQLFGSFGELLRISSPFDRLMGSLRHTYSLGVSVAGMSVFVSSEISLSQTLTTKDWVLPDFSSCLMESMIL
jgi:hypothetical protein